MPFVRNPFRRQDENVRPLAVDTVDRQNSYDAGAATKPIDVVDQEPAEYKLSDINDSGICIPPSPVERKSFWGHTNSSRSTTSSNHRSLINEAEQFNISRESFESYRRSFDISGRSPVIQPNERNQRGSFDHWGTAQPAPRMSNSFSRPAPVPIIPPAPREEDFEDVGLEEEEVKPHLAKKKGLFARLTDATNEQSTNNSVAAESTRPLSGHEKSWHHFGVGGGRKRGQSGQGAELANFVPPQRDQTTPKPIDKSAFQKPSTPRPVEASTQAPITV